MSFVPSPSLTFSLWRSPVAVRRVSTCRRAAEQFVPIITLRAYYICTEARDLGEEVHIGAQLDSMAISRVRAARRLICCPVLYANSHSNHVHP
jgi:hypothetical protein